jgi:hypothetical protein
VPCAASATSSSSSKSLKNKIDRPSRRSQKTPLKLPHSTSDLGRDLRVKPDPYNQ